MKIDRYYFGDIIDHTPAGDVVRRMAVVLQRRESMDRKRKYVFQIVGCPYCGEHHEHGDGPGFVSPHCRDRDPSRRDYLIMDTPLPVVPWTTPYPGKKSRPRRTWG